MKKLAIVIFLSLTSIANAEQNYFVGGSIATTDGEASASYQDSNIERTQEYGVKIGFEDNIYRAYLGSSKIKWNNSEAKTTLINGELLFPLGNPLGTKKDMKLYMGLHYGEINFKTDLTGNNTDVGKMHGIQIGLLSPCVLNEKITLELGFRNSIVNATTQNTTYSHELNSLDTVSFGINYSF